MQKRSEPVYLTRPQGGPGVRSVAEEDVWNEESETGALFTEHWHAHAPPSRTPTCLLGTAGLTYPRQGTGKFYSGETYSSHRRNSRNSHESRSENARWPIPQLGDPLGKMPYSHTESLELTLGSTHFTWQYNQGHSGLNSFLHETEKCTQINRRGKK